MSLNWSQGIAIPFSFTQLTFSEVCYSAGEYYVYVLGNDTAFYKYNISTGSWTELASPTYEGSNISHRALSFSPNGEYLACISEVTENYRGGKRIEIYDIAGDSWSQSSQVQNMDDEQPVSCPTVISGLVWADNDTIWTWASEATAGVKDYGRCIKYTVSTDTFTIYATLCDGGLTFSSPLGMAINDAGTIVYIPIVGASARSWYKYTIGTDSYALGGTLTTGLAFSAASSPDRLLFIDTSDYRQGYLYAEDDSEYPGQFPENTDRDSGYGNKYGVNSDVTCCICWAESTSPWIWYIILASESPFVPVTPTKITVPHSGGAWQDVDLSAYIPAFAIGVVGIFEHSDATATGFGFRKKGSTDDRRARASGSVTVGIVVGCDSDRIIQFNSNSSFDQYFYLIAYIIRPNALLLTNATDVSPTGTGAWETVDLSSECPGATGIILEVYNSGVGFDAFGARKYGSTDNRLNTTYGHNAHDIIIGCDSSQQIQLYSGAATVEFYLRGYITGGVEFYTDAVEITPTNTGTWEEKATPSGKVDIYRYDSGKKFWLTGYQGADIIFVEVESDASGGAGVREADGTVVPNGYALYHPWLYSLVADNDAPDALIEMAFAQSIFTESPSWTDVSDEALSYYVKRGREHDLNRIEAGTAVVVMKNLNGDWYRYYTSGTYYPDVKPITLIRITLSHGGISYRRFYGIIEGFKHGWLDSGRVPIVTISCVDIFKSFNRRMLYPLPGTVGPFQEIVGLASDAASAQKEVVIQSLADSETEGCDINLLHEGQSVTIGDDNNNEVNTIASIDVDTYTLTMTDNLANTYQTADNAYVKKFPSVLSGTRINDVRCELGWPSSLSDIDTGQLYVAEFVPDADGTPALEHLLAVAESEGGIVFISRSGLLTFQDRDARLSSPLNTSQATFSDDGNNKQYIASGPEDDDTFIYNEARISGDAITAQIYRDATKQASQGIRIFPRSGSLLYTSGDAFDQAYQIVERYKDSILRIPDFTVIPDIDAPVLFPLILPFDISTRINVRMNTNPNVANLNQNYHIEGIEEQWQSGELWRTKWQLWDVNLFRIFQAAHTGYLQKNSLVSYATAHDAANADSALDDSTVIGVGQLCSGASDWWLWRGFLQFDTSSIGAAASIASAELILEISGYFVIDTEFDIVLVSGADLANPLDVSDYGTLLSQTTSYGSVTVSPSEVNKKTVIITLNSTGLAAINQTGTTVFGLRSSRDISDTDPGANGDEYVTLSGTGTDVVPRLTVKLNEAFAS